MPIYTLADGSTVTVTATEQGIPFNEGMQALTKAIKAKINASSSGSGGASSSSKLEPTLTLSLQGDGTFTWTYNGDGIVLATGFGDTTIHTLLDYRNARAYDDSSDYYNNALVKLSEGSGSTKNIAWTWGASGQSSGMLVILHATEGEQYASKTVWAEQGEVPNYDGTLFAFNNSGTL